METPTGGWLKCGCGLLLLLLCSAEWVGPAAERLWVSSAPYNSAGEEVVISATAIRPCQGKACRVTRATNLQPVSGFKPLVSPGGTFVPLNK